MRFATTLILAGSLWCSLLSAANFYVSPDASPGGTGTLNDPWSLQTALTNAAVQPGDTIWLRGGTYFPILTNTGNVQLTNGPSWLVTICPNGRTVEGCNGTASAPVTLRSYTNEWAAIDRPWYWSWMPQKGGYLVFRDLEFYNSLKGNMATNVSYPNGPWGHFYFSPSWVTGIQFVNCLIHDVDNLFGGPVETSVRGCVIWHVGLDGYEHVCYPAPKQFSGNICAWTVNDVIEHTTYGCAFTSNIVFGDGYTSSAGGLVARMDTGSYQVIGNCIYDYFPTLPYHHPQGIRLGGTDCLVSNNVIVSPDPLPMSSEIPNSVTIVGNTIQMNSPDGNANVLNAYNTTIGSWTINSNHYTALAPYSVQFADNGSRVSWSQWRSENPAFDTDSTATNAASPPDRVIVIPNQDQSRRCNIAVYNFSLKDNVTANLSAILKLGDPYQLYSAQNYKAGPIQTGTFNGTTISLPMTNLTTAPILYGANWGLTQPRLTSPEFAAFVVIGRSAGQPQPAANLRQNLR